MYIHSVNLDVNAQPDANAKPCLRLSQNENGRILMIRIIGVDIPEGSTANFAGVKPDGNVYSKAGTVEGNVVSINEDIQMTAVSGAWNAKITVVNDGNNICTARIRVVVDASVVPGDAIPSDSQLDGIVAECQAYAESAKNAAYGSPLTANTAAGMTDQDRVYVYTGSETGYTAGHWYYYDGSAWADGGVYNAVAVQTDTTLTQAGKAADAKKTGDEITALKEDLSDIRGTLVEKQSGIGEVTLANAENMDKFVVSVSGAMQQTSYDGGVAIYVPFSESSTERNPYIASGYNLGSGTWMVGFKFRFTKLDSSIGNPKYLQITIGSNTITKITNYTMGEWDAYQNVATIDLTRIRIAAYGFPTAPNKSQLSLEVKELYVYDVASVNDELRSYIQSQQESNYQDGTVTYGSASANEYLPDDSLSLAGKSADAGAVGDALQAVNSRIDNIKVTRVETVEFTNACYINSNGEEVSSNESVTTDYISLDEVEAVSYTGKMGANSCAHWYDSNKTYLTSTICNVDVMQWYVNALRTRPTGAKYLRLTSKKLTASTPPDVAPEAVVYYDKNYAQYLVDQIVGDGVTDDTLALQKAINLSGDVSLQSTQQILVSSPIYVDLCYSKSINGNGATVIVSGDFYAFSVKGTLTTSSNPNNVSEVVMKDEAATRISGLRITSATGLVGGGIEVNKAFKLSIIGNYIYKCKNGLRLYGRNRDIIIAENNIYAIQNDGLLFDGVDLHQCNIVNNMIQYAMVCLHILDPSAIANFQIDSNDIEISTYPTGYENAIAVLFESNIQPGQFSEIEICGNTIQGHGTSSDVIKMIGDSTVPISEMSIVGNHISNSGSRAIWLENCLNVAISSNTYKDISAYLYELHGNCSQITIIGDVARYVYRGRIYADSSAVLNRIICKYVICRPYGEDNIETTNVSNLDIT